ASYVAQEVTTAQGEPAGHLRRLVESCHLFGPPTATSSSISQTADSRLSEITVLRSDYLWLTKQIVESRPAACRGQPNAAAECFDKPRTVFVQALSRPSARKPARAGSRRQPDPHSTPEPASTLGWPPYT